MNESGGAWALLDMQGFFNFIAALCPAQCCACAHYSIITMPAKKIFLLRYTEKTS